MMAEEAEDNGQFEIEKDLVTTYRNQLVSIMTGVTNNKSLAEDITHDALVAVINKLRSNDIDNIEFLGPYLRKTAYYMYISSLRKSSNKTEAEGNLDLYQSDQPYLDAHLEQARLVETIHLLIQELPVERDKQILQRKYIDDEAKPSICDSLNLSLEHFDRVIGRARQRLKRIALKREITLAIL